MEARNLIPRHGGMDMGNSATNVSCTVEVPTYHIIDNWNRIF